MASISGDYLPIVVGVAFLGAAFVGICVWLHSRSKIKSVALVVRERPASPLTTLSFDDALSLDRFSTEIQRYELESLARATGLAPLQCMVQGVSIAQQSREVTLLCKMSDAVRRAYESGQAQFLTPKAGDGLYPVLQDVDTGRTFEIMKGQAARWLKASELATMIVSAAHIISGIDLSRKPSDANRKLDRLLTARRMDQTAKLERIFAASKERLIEGPTIRGIVELRSYRDELRELRAAWRRELAYGIGTAPDPSIKPSLKFWGRTGRERTMARHINSDLSYVALMYVAFLLDICLADATGMTHLLLEHTLPDELSAIENLRNTLTGKAQLLKKEKDGLSEAQSAVESLCVMLQGIGGQMTSNSGLALRG